MQLETKTTQSDLKAQVKVMRDSDITDALYVCPFLHCESDTFPDSKSVLSSKCINVNVLKLITCSVVSHSFGQHSLSAARRAVHQHTSGRVNTNLGRKRYEN